MFPQAIVEALEAALSSAARTGALPSLDVAVEVERPRERQHGDWASNLALAAAKAAERPPGDVAQLLLDNLPEIPQVASVELAGPGFINFRLDRTWLEGVVRRAAAEGPMWGSTQLPEPDSRILVEFVSTNPTGPLHVGHGRGAVLGDSIARLLTYTRHDVSREYYVNDAGVQIDLFGSSLYARYLQALGREADLPKGGYQGEYLAEWGRELADADGDAHVGEIPVVQAWGLERALADISAALGDLGVEFADDEWFRERFVVERGDVDRALAAMKEKGYVYDAEGATWFRATEFGDEKDRVLIKSDGTYTYLTPDIAYHWDKYERGFDVLINVWGSDHHGYQPRLKAGVEAFGKDPDSLEVIITQLVKVLRAGAEVRMSTRAGEFVPLQNVIEEVGSDATRYYLAAFSPDTAVSFDLELAKRQTMDNPVYYLQYAYARIVSLERFAAGEGIERVPVSEADLSLVGGPAEDELMRQIDRWPEEVSAASTRRAPHRITAFGYELAGAFHRFYSDVRIIGESEGRPILPEVTQARLWLVEATKSTLLAVLDILGIAALEEM